LTQGLTLGSNIFTQILGYTAVFNFHGKYETLKLFIQRGANLDSVNNAGRTPRQMAETIFPAEFERIKLELII
jgi:hypothetical protein